MKEGNDIFKTFGLLPNRAPIHGGVSSLVKTKTGSFSKTALMCSLILQVLLVDILDKKINK